jgi:uroporphyrinogen-III synthase
LIARPHRSRYAVLITRPEKDAAPLSAALKEHGVDAMIEPLLRIDVLPGPPLDVAGVQAVLATSANGVRALQARQVPRDLPLFAVGEATAAAARTAGFDRVETAKGDVASLAGLARARLAPAAGALLHACGSAVAGDLAAELGAAGFRYRRAVLYAARTIDALSPGAQHAIARGTVAGVLLYSPRTAMTFVRLTRACGLDPACRSLAAFCLSDAVADAVAGVHWAHLVIADRPQQAAMVAAVVGAARASALR